MNREPKCVEGGLAIGVLCAMALIGCAGNTSPISPSTLRPALGANTMAAPSLDTPISQRTTDGMSALAQGLGAENRWVACYPGAGGFVQISVHAMGMAGAIRHCLKDLNGRVDGVIRPPLP
jgi:hypothetical protein